MRNIGAYKAFDGRIFEDREECQEHEKMENFVKETGLRVSKKEYEKIEEWFENQIRIRRTVEMLNNGVSSGFVPATQLKPFFDKTPETLHKEALEYGERWEKPNNPGIGSNR